MLIWQINQNLVWFISSFVANMRRLFLLLALVVWCCYGHGNHGQGDHPGQNIPADQFNIHDPKITQDEA